MKAGLLCVILLLAGVAHARDEDSPFDIDEVVAPSEPKAIVNKPRFLSEELPKTKPAPATEEAAKKKVTPAEEVPAKTKPATTPETASLKTKVKATAKEPATESAAPKTKTATKEPAADKKASTTDTPAKKTSTVTSEESAPKKVSKPAPTSQPPAIAPVIPASTSTSAATIVNLQAPPPVEQRQQQILIDNVQKIDSMNRELLTKNQSLQLENEKLTLQVELLRQDRSSEHMRDGALAIIIGLFLGWAISSNKRRHSKWS